MKLYFLYLAFFASIPWMFSQEANWMFKKDYSDVTIIEGHESVYSFNLKAYKPYQFKVYQQGIDVKVTLKENDNTLMSVNSPNGSTGYEEILYTPEHDGEFSYVIERMDMDDNPTLGSVDVVFSEYTWQKIEDINQAKAKLERENKKSILTLDVNHFWEAYDGLANANNHIDSIRIIQEVYLDRASTGLQSFMQVRPFTAEHFVRAIKNHPKFYESVRGHTLEISQSSDELYNLYTEFEQVYPNLKPFKVCFAIGLTKTGGTVNNNFVLIGSELTTANKETDTSDLKNELQIKMIKKQENYHDNIRYMVAHESVHTQQFPATEAANNCPLLYESLLEGTADFIGELISGGHINEYLHEYGNAHEAELWQEFKANICSRNTRNWLYNQSFNQDRPGDLGYFIGYKIGKAYYDQADNKQQAVIDMIELKDPWEFLVKSGYDNTINP